MKIRPFLVSILLYSCVDTPKTLPVVFYFPHNLKEVSAVEVPEKSGLIWVCEDSGNKPELYALDAEGKIVNTVTIKNTDNNDWEDLTSDQDGNLYIGDFGNNDNNRENLAIYEISASDLTKSDAAIAKKIEFYYPEQKDFPPKKSQRFYDCEAFFYYKDNFYLFTKNRSSKFDGTTMLYKVANKTGHNPAQLIGKFKTCDEFRKCAITSADISPDGKIVILLSCAKAWLFENYKNDDFLNGKVREIDLQDYTQKEGIGFLNNSEVYISDEREKKIGGKLYKLKL
ncbi:MAG: hypothetical protein PSV16_04615 [Flavobacterium sp.]|nr:hypothetical protein [Flavobacterium sp.]